MWFQCRNTESVQLRITVPLISLSGRCELLMWSVVLFGRFGSLHAQPTFRIESSDWQLVIGPQPPTLQPCRERPHALMPPCCIFKSCLPRGHWPHVHPVRRWEQVCASRAYRSCIMQNLTAFIMILCICWAAVEKNDNISDLPMFILPLKSRSLSPDYHHSRGSVLHSWPLQLDRLLPHTVVQSQLQTRTCLHSASPADTRLHHLFQFVCVAFILLCEASLVLWRGAIEIWAIIISCGVITWCSNTNTNQEDTYTQIYSCKEFLFSLHSSTDR